MGGKLEDVPHSSEERFELKLVISKELHDQINELKMLLSHSLQDGGTTSLLEYLVSQEIKRQKKKRGFSEVSADLPEEEGLPNLSVTAAPGYG